MVSIYNLILHQKATYRRQFKIDYYLRVLSTLMGGNQIVIAPLPIAIPSGQVLDFANGSIVTTANYDPGEDRIDVGMVNFEIKRGERVAIAPVDLTAHVFESRIRTDYEGTILNEVDVSAPAPGLLQIEIDWQETLLIPSNISLINLPSNPQNPQQFNLAACNSRIPPYVWQLFSQLGTVRDRTMEGRVLVTPDV